MSRDEYRLSFETVADAYERARPGYAPEAVEWIAERLPFGRVLDLAAGTGKLTRQLVAQGADVVAVEPGAEMRSVLARVLPDVEVLAGSAEAIPLPDESVDTVTVAQAFHWFRAAEALAEIHRVLRPGGGVALLWNEWDLDDPRVRRIDDLIEPLRGRVGRHDDWRRRLEESALYARREVRMFRHNHAAAPDVVAERVLSISVVAAAKPAERARLLDEVRAIVAGREIDFPLVTTVGIADRVN